MSDLMKMHKEAQRDIRELAIKQRRLTPKPKLDSDDYDQNTAMLDDEHFQDIDPDDGKGDRR